MKKSHVFELNELCSQVNIKLFGNNTEHLAVVSDIIIARISLTFVDPIDTDFEYNGAYGARIVKILEASFISASGLNWVDIFTIMLSFEDVSTSIDLDGTGGCDPDKFTEDFKKILTTILTKKWG